MSNLSKSQLAALSPLQYARVFESIHNSFQNGFNGPSRSPRSALCLSQLALLRSKSAQFQYALLAPSTGDRSPWDNAGLVKRYGSVVNWFENPAAN